MLDPVQDHARDRGRPHRDAARRSSPSTPDPVHLPSLELALARGAPRMLPSNRARAIRALGRLAGNSAVQHLLQVSRAAVEVDAPPPDGVGLDKPGGFTEWPIPERMLDLKPARPTLTPVDGEGEPGVTWNAGEQPKDGTYRSWATPADRYALGEIRKVNPGLVLVAPGFLTISPTDHALIRQGEREHVTDLERAFAMTHEALYRAALSLAGTVYRGSPPILAQFAAVEALRQQAAGLGDKLTPRRLSQLAADVDAAYHLLRRKTKQRDDNGWHTLRNKRVQMDDPYRIEVSISHKRAYEIGTHSSAEVVTW